MSSRFRLSEEEGWTMADLMLKFNTLSFNRLGLESHTEWVLMLMDGMLRVLWSAFHVSC